MGGELERNSVIGIGGSDRTDHIARRMANPPGDAFVHLGDFWKMEGTGKMMRMGKGRDVDVNNKDHPKQ